MNDKEILIFLYSCAQTHLEWAEHFEDNPDIEQEYISSGEWDSAEIHRKWVDKYKETITRFKELIS